MFNHTDKAIDGTEKDMKGEKPHKPREKYFFCIAWKTKQWGPIEASTPEEAKELWAANHEGIAPNVVCGGDILKDVGGGTGYYLAKGTGMGDVQRISVTVSATHLRYTTTNIKAEFRGWIVYGNGIKAFQLDQESYADDELAMLVFDSPVDKDKKIPKPKLKKNEAVRVSDLNIISSS